MERKKRNCAIKVLICDDTVANGVKMASELTNLGFYAYTRKNTGDAVLRSILTDKPDAVVSDISLGDTDAISVIQKSKSILSKSPSFIIFSEINNSFIERQILQNGASYFLAKPFGIDELCKAIKSVVFRDFDFEISPGCDVEIMATELIQKVGIPANIRGYRYVRTAIIECVENNIYLNSITKLLYPKVAEKHNTTPTKVERAIRHAIDVAWQSNEAENIYSYFGYKSSGLMRPTNSRFISLATDKISLILKRKNNHENLIGF